MTPSNVKLRVRMYRVGFGDFFLISLATPKGRRHILVDCGVHAGDLGSISDGVADLAKETGSHLSLIIVTHRHADHISGFATCAKQFQDFTVDAIWMSWWDDPANAKATAFQASLTALARKLEPHLALRAADDDDARQALAMVHNVTGQDGSSAAAKGGGAGGRLGSNDAALALLRGAPPSGGPRFKSTPVRHYYKAGDPPELPPDLVDAGLAVRVLGPPTDPKLVAQMSSAVEEYLSMAGEEAEARPLIPFGDRWRVPADAYDRHAFYPFSSKELAQLVQSVQPDALLAAARKADNTINNQSLVVHLTVGGKNLLFVGDAQWGNWANFLFGGTATSRTSGLLSESKRLLGAVDFYKVGHHGSTNATPIDAVKALRDGCVAMCSTQPGCYGQAAKGTEVPRGPLLDALRTKAKGALARSDQIALSHSPATRGLPPLAPIFSPGGALYIDYEF